MLVAVMTRIPQPGLTKTRLETHLTKVECAQLHCAFIQDTVAMLDKTALPYQIFYNPEGELSRLSSIVPPQASLVPQEGVTLGDKMAHALSWCFAQGHPSAAVLGTDLPTLQPEILLEAAEILRTKDAVIGPAGDGGYYLLGMNKLYPKFFSENYWGTDKIFSWTVHLMDNLGLSWGVLPHWDDIDTFADLTKLIDLLAGEDLSYVPEHTKRYLQQQDYLP